MAAIIPLSGSCRRNLNFRSRFTVCREINLPSASTFGNRSRLRPGVSLTQAQAELDKIISNWVQTYKDNYGGGGFGAKIYALHNQVVGQMRPGLGILLGAVVFVLLIACANLATMLLARASARERELAIRVAPGAGRWRLLR